MPVDRSSLAWKIVLTVLMVTLILAVANLFVIVASVLLLILAGFLFGIFINGISRWLAGLTHLPYHVGYTAVVVLLVAIAAGGIYLMGSQIANQMSTLSKELQSSAQQLTNQLQRSSWAKHYLPDLSKMKELLAGNSVLPRVVNTLQWVGWAVTSVLVIFFVGLYTAYDPELYKSGLIKLLPQDRRPRIRQLLDKLNAALGRWIIGRLISMTIVGVLTAIGLWLLDVPLPIPLGVLAALLTFVPNIGPVLAAVPQALMALQSGTQTVLYVILFNIALQTVESYLITPMIERYQVTLPPAVTIAAQLIMGVTVGVIGVVMAAPLVAILMVVVQVLYIHDRLGDSDPGELAETT